MKRIEKPIMAILLSMFCVLAAACQAPLPAPENAVQTSPDLEEKPMDYFSLLFVNVGKADALLICANGHYYMVDTGEKESLPKLFGALHRLGIRELDGVFLTHTHNDHIGGMEALAQYLDIAMLYHAEITTLTKKGNNKFDTLARELSIPRTSLKAGDTLRLNGGAALEVLAPREYNEKDDNDNSLVLMLRVNGRRILLTGDMQFAEENTLLASGCELSADVLKVGNHGNPDATGDAFAKAVSPAFAVISTDTSVDTDSANPRVTAALGGAQIHITQDYGCGVLLRIDKDGNIAVSDVSHDDASPALLSIMNIDKAAQTITLHNDGEAADISGYMIFSEKGGELFVFPEGSQAAKGQTLTVACEGKNGDYIWHGEKQVWNTKKNDAGVLYDAYGNALCRVAAK